MKYIIILFLIQLTGFAETYEENYCLEKQKAFKLSYKETLNSVEEYILRDEESKDSMAEEMSLYLNKNVNQNLNTTYPTYHSRVTNYINDLTSINSKTIREHENTIIDLLLTYDLHQIYHIIKKSSNKFIKQYNNNGQYKRMKDITYRTEVSDKSAWISWSFGESLRSDELYYDGWLFTKYSLNLDNVFRNKNDSNFSIKEFIKANPSQVSAALAAKINVSYIDGSFNFSVLSKKVKKNYNNMIPVDTYVYEMIKRRHPECLQVLGLK
ncbi:hypothetical protein N9N67_05850 [Bacteriovoracaceae bacterium]|nr:hypothetical protein [Bacteriovoracaceae bacterium]